MAIVRCDRGHYYDNVKFSQCPHCGIGFMMDEDDDKTVAMVPQGTDDGDKTVEMRPIVPDPQPVRKTEDDDDKTISIYAQEQGTEPIVGWLVCVEGVERGKDYRLHQGFNRLGRDTSMDVALMQDASISREAACAIVYDDRSNAFYAAQQSGGSAYLNGTALEGAVQLSTGDLIRTGNSEFEFIAFCREGRSWN